MLTAAVVHPAGDTAEMSTYNVVVRMLITFLYAFLTAVIT